MQNSLSITVKKLFQVRDELSFRNIRGSLWPVLLVFPLSVIVGDLRYFDLNIAVGGLQSWELMLYPLGLGWLVLVFVPRKFIIPLLRLAAVFSILLLPFQFIITEGIGRLSVFMAFQFLNGICAACAFSLFCFRLNNIERLFAMAMIQLYYGFYYTVWRTFPIVQSVGKTWGGAAIVAFYVVVVFLCRRQEFTDTDKDGKGSGAQFVIGLDVVYYMIMCMINYIAWEQKSVSSIAFGIGSVASIILIIFIQLIRGRNALYIWLLFLAFSLFGLGILIYDTSVTRFSGSLVYGLGDGLGYIIIYYLCAGAIKRSRSLKMFRLYCFVFFIEYFFISGLYSRAFGMFVGPNHHLALGIVLVLCSGSFLLVPLMQRKLFGADWTDGIHLKGMEEYTQPLAETEAININNQLNLTLREHEVFTMLLTGAAVKEIAYTLKISYDTARFHQKNLYRKLDVQSIQELFTKYGREEKVLAKPFG